MLDTWFETNFRSAFERTVAKKITIDTGIFQIVSLIFILLFLNTFEKDPETLRRMFDFHT